MLQLADIRFIGVGSTNQVKIKATRKVWSNYGLRASVKGISVPSGVAEEPGSLEEIIRGAENRAQGALARGGFDVGIGIESGLFDVPGTLTGRMNICACTIFDGEAYHLGLSSAFECPVQVMKLVQEKGHDLNTAFHKAKITNTPKVGSAEGAIGILTMGRITRMDYTIQALMMAMIQLEHPEWYPVSV